MVEFQLHVFLGAQLLWDLKVSGLCLCTHVYNIMSFTFIAVGMLRSIGIVEHWMCGESWSASHKRP